MRGNGHRLMEAVLSVFRDDFRNWASYKKVYVAGPYRALTHWETQQNIMKAAEVALQVWQTEKAVAVFPHGNSYHFQGSIPDKHFGAGYLALLAGCDGVIFVEGWRDSEGSQEEYKLAVLLSMPIFYTVEDLSEWLLEDRE